MGIFDYVEYEMHCPDCGSVLRNFQSSSEECTMAHLKPRDVSHMYDMCLSCKAFVAVSIQRRDSYSYISEENE